MEEKTAFESLYWVNGIISNTTITLKANENQPALCFLLGVLFPKGGPTCVPISHFLPWVLTFSQELFLPPRCWDMAGAAVQVICKVIWENAKLSRARQADWKSGGHYIHFLKLHWALQTDIHLQVPGCSKSPTTVQLWKVKVTKWFYWIILIGFLLAV